MADGNNNLHFEVLRDQKTFEVWELKRGPTALREKQIFHARVIA